MSYCTKCGRDVEKGLAVCPYCGQDIIENGGDSGGTATPRKFNLFTAYMEMLKRYSEFGGRSSRSEFWYAYLMDFIIAVIFGVIYIVMLSLALALESDGIGIAGMLVALLAFLYVLSTMIPRIALHIRRLHDTGKSGWFYLLSLIPEVGMIVVLVLCALEPQAGENKYGPDPRYK